MSKADKMFEELGFVKTDITKSRNGTEFIEIEYRQSKEWLGERVTFYDSDRRFDVNGTTDARTAKAILEKLKELGWIE